MSRCSLAQSLSITHPGIVRVARRETVSAGPSRASRLPYFFSVVPSIITTQLVPSSDISQLKLIFFGVTRVIV